MDNKKDDRYYATKAIADIDAISKYMRGKSYDGFVSDGLLTDAIMFRLIQLVESIKNISDSCKREHPEIHWGEIIGFRNGIVHEYGKTDYTIVYEIVT